MDIYELGFKYHSTTESIGEALKFVFKSDLQQTLDYFKKEYSEETLYWDFKDFETLEQYLQMTLPDTFEQIFEDINYNIKDVYLSYFYDGTGDYHLELYSFDQKVLIDYFCNNFFDMLNEKTKKELCARKI